MKPRILSLLLAGACVNMAHAQFNPVVLTPSSYTFDIVVEASAPQALPYCINVTAGSGTGLGDNTYYEQGLYARAGQPGGNSGVPIHNTTFTSINNPNMHFLMPPDYTVNNDAFVDSQFAAFGPSVLTFNTPVTATNLAILNCGGGGTVVVNYTVTHSDSSTETGTLNLLDWFTGGGTVAWGANGRITSGGGYNNYNSSAVNNNAPYLYANQITVSGASPVASLTLTYVSGQHANFFAVSGNNTGTWTPIPLAASSFNAMGLVPATFPLTATMDQGTNTSNNGNLATWFEQGFDHGVTGGLPASGSTFTSLTQPTHTYQMGNYSANNAILIDTNHQTANITPATPANYSSFAFLTAGGNVGGNPMTNICILQHADGINETNIFYGYDWFDGNHNGSIALKVGGRVNMYSRTINQIGNNFPYLFESYFILADTGSPVTNIVLHYGTSGSTSSTTYVMAVSAASGAVLPVVNSGPTPSSQTVFPGATASFVVGVTGTQPITGYWQVENNGSFVNLTNGLDANGSIIIGAQTMSLTISNIYPADSTNYQYVANNVAGSGISPLGQLIVTSQTNIITPAAPTYYDGNNITLTAKLNGGPAVSLQWFYIDNSGLGVTNLIAGATNSTYTILNTPAVNTGYTYGIISSNIYGVNVASVVITANSDSAAFLGADLAPLQAEAYAGAPVTYSFNAQGNSPITYQWFVNGSIVSGVNSNKYTLVTPCGGATVQVAFSNLLSGGVLTYTSMATLQGDANPTNITFNVPGAGWRINTNGTGNNLGAITNGVLLLTDNGSGEGVSTFYTNAQYVGGSWTAAFTYNSHAGAADGMAFILQTTNITALGGPGGQLGYGGISPSLAFEINLYNGNSQVIGATVAVNGATGIYQATGAVNVNGTNDVNVVLNWANGVMAVTLSDAVTGATYSTNYNVGSLTSILGGNVAYIGFSGGDGGSTSLQTVKNFSFHSVLPAVPLTASVVSGGSFTLSWSAADTAYVLQTTTSLTSPSWVAGPTPTNVGGVNHVSVSVTGGTGQQFYRIVRIACP